MSDGLGEGAFILVMSLEGFILCILLMATPFVAVVLLVAILKFNGRMKTEWPISAYFLNYPSYYLNLWQEVRLI